MEAHDSDLADENPGSRWPKTTLGALRDGHVLRWREAVALRQACDALNHRLRTAPDRLCVRALTVVRSRCKSLERRRYSLSVPLMHPEPPPTHAPPAPHRRSVERTLQQFDRQNLWAYWKAHLRDGARESHYRALHVESTLVIDVRHQLPILNAFVDRVESVLPGRYVWFSPSSRHVTLRTLRR